MYTLYNKFQQNTTPSMFFFILIFETDRLGLSVILCQHHSHLYFDNCSKLEILLKI